MKGRALKRIWITLAALGIGVSLLVNNSTELIESNTNKISTVIIKK